MSKQKRVSISSIEKTMKEIYTPTETVEWNGVEILVKRTLSFDESMIFVRGVVQGCFASDGEYMPEVKDFLVKNYIIESYTNVALPSNTSDRYSLIYKSELTDFIMPHINQPQFNSMMNAVDEKLRSISQANMNLINKKAAELFESIESIETQMSDIMSSIGSEDIIKLVGAISDGGLDERKLVEAFKGNEVKPKVKAIKNGDD